MLSLSVSSLDGLGTSKNKMHPQNKMLGSDPFYFHFIFLIFYFKWGSSSLILFRYPGRGLYTCLFISDLAGLLGVYAAWSFPLLLQSYGCASSKFKCTACKAASNTGTHDACTNAELNNPETTCKVSEILAAEFWCSLWFLGVNSRSIWHIRQWRWHVAPLNATSALPTKEANQYPNLMQQGQRNKSEVTSNCNIRVDWN